MTDMYLVFKDGVGRFEQRERIPTHDEIAVCAYYNWEVNEKAGEPDFINTPLRNWYDAVVFMTEVLNPPLPPQD